MYFNEKSLMLYAITDCSWLNGRTLAKQVEEALIGGITMIQLREKALSIPEFIAEAKMIRQITKEYGVPLIINDNVEVAIASNADGVHVGQNDVSVIEARTMLGKEKIIGATAKTVRQARMAEEQGADYIGSGTVFGSDTKTNAIKITIEQLNEIASSVTIPTVVVGGISKDNINKFYGSNIKGVAVVSAIFACDNIARATRDLYQDVETILQGNKQE